MTALILGLALGAFAALLHGLMLQHALDTALRLDSGKARKQIVRSMPLRLLPYIGVALIAIRFGVLAVAGLLVGHLTTRTAVSIWYYCSQSKGVEA